MHCLCWKVKRLYVPKTLEPIHSGDQIDYIKKKITLCRKRMIIDRLQSESTIHIKGQSAFECKLLVNKKCQSILLLHTYILRECSYYLKWSVLEKMVPLFGTKNSRYIWNKSETLRRMYFLYLVTLKIVRVKIWYFCIYNQDELVNDRIKIDPDLPYYKADKFSRDKKKKNLYNFYDFVLVPF